MNLSGKHAVVLGRSNIVGLPVASLLQAADATVTICHSKTVNLEKVIGLADVVVAAVGQANLVKGSWLKPGAVVIDVGTNALPDSSKKAGYRWVGDVGKSMKSEESKYEKITLHIIDFETALPVASAITPVPGGVGPLTVAMLLDNTVESALRYMRGFYKPMEYLKLNLETPVPR